MKISWLVGKYEHSSQLANYAISTTSEREFESGEISRETQCREPRYFYGPGTLHTASRYHRFGRIVARRKRLKGGFVANEKAEEKKKGERGWSRRKTKQGVPGKVAEKCRERSEKRESGSRNEARKEFSDGNVGTLRVFLAAAARGAVASGCRVSVRLVTEYKCGKKYRRRKGARGVLKWAETREREASSDKAAKRTCKYMRDPKGQPR